MERCPTRFRIGDRKLTHGHSKPRKHPPTWEGCGEDTPLTIKHVLMERSPLRNKIHKFFDSTKKTMKQFLYDEDTSYGGTLYKFVTNLDLLTKL